MMEQLDFLFIYEHKVRELENLCLMKYELDRRGYRTKIVYIDDAQNALQEYPIYHTKVLCTMACYDNSTLYWHTKEYVKFDKVIDLQWENIVYAKDEDREEAYKNYWGIGKEVVHVSWGKQNVNRLLNAAHLDERKVKLTGHVGMDFLRPPLNRYYMSREELFEKYGIPVQKRVILFASPYFGDQLTDEYIAGMCRAFGDDWPQYYDFMCDSQKIVLSWLEELCKQDANIYVVFRPHPGHPSSMAERLEKTYDNFSIIATESVKQWIVTCDKVYTGNSSVVVEAFFAKKMCQLLFPLPTTPGFELKLITDSKKISTFEDFTGSVYSDSEEFPTPEESIEEIYLIDWEKPNYVRFADMAEEVLRDDYYRIPGKELRKYKEYGIAQCINRLFVNMKPVYRFYLSLLHNPRIHWKIVDTQRRIREENRDMKIQFEQKQKHELTSEEEIMRIINRIQYALET